MGKTKERLQVVRLPRKIRGNTHMRVLRPRMQFELGNGVHFNRAFNAAHADFQELLSVFKTDKEFLSAMH
jgi:hypothetical protein